MDIQVDGAGEARAKMQKLIDGIQNLQPAFDEMQEPIIQEFKANFTGKGQVLEEPWPPRKHQYPWPMLIKTGTMQKAWSGKSSPQDLEIKNTTDYATYQHFGTGTIAPRKLVSDRSKTLIKLAKNYVEKYIKSLIS